MIGIREMPLIYIFLPILGYALFKRGQLLKQALNPQIERRLDMILQGEP